MLGSLTALSAYAELNASDAASQKVINRKPSSRVNLKVDYLVNNEAPGGGAAGFRYTDTDNNVVCYVFTQPLGAGGVVPITSQSVSCVKLP